MADRPRRCVIAYAKINGEERALQFSIYNRVMVIAHNRGDPDIRDVSKTADCGNQNGSAMPFLGDALRTRCVRAEGAQMLGAQLPACGPSRGGFAWGGTKSPCQKKI